MEKKWNRSKQKGEDEQVVGERNGWERCFPQIWTELYSYFTQIILLNNMKLFHAKRTELRLRYRMWDLFQ